MEFSREKGLNLWAFSRENNLNSAFPWIQHGGGNILEWMQKLDGRIDILHLKDMGIHELDKPFITEIGQGNINFDPIIELAGKIGVKHYVVEQDYCPGDPLESMKISSDYIHKKYMK